MALHRPWVEQWDCYGPTYEANQDEYDIWRAPSTIRMGYIVVDIRWYVSNDRAHGYNQADPNIRWMRTADFLPAVNRFPSVKAEGDSASGRLCA